VIVPSLLACLILGGQLDRQTRAIFASNLAAQLETFTLILGNNENSLAKGVVRTAADNTLQVTLDLGIATQLAHYLDQQRGVLEIDFLAAYQLDGKSISYSSAADEPGRGQWRIARTVDNVGADCAVARQPLSITICDGVAYLTSLQPVDRRQDANRGDAATGNPAGERLGYLLGGVRVAGPALIDALRQRQITFPAIWADDWVVYANLPVEQPLELGTADHPAQQYTIAGETYLGAAKRLEIGGQRLTYGVLAPLAPLRVSLAKSVLTVVGAGLVLAILTLIALSFIANRISRPIQLLREGAARIGAGELDRRLDIHTGDELEALANQFNRMAADLQTSYAGLEHKVEERTAELSEARDAAEGALRELRTAQASLIQAEKMASLGQLTAGIAHEIKNPLNFVNNFASLSNELLGELKEIAAPAIAGLDANKRAEIDETMELLSGNLERIAEHGKRADGIVKSMLEHSRGGSGERQAVDLNALLEESLNLAYHGARAQDQGFNITLERDFDKAMKPVELVPQDIARVFLNLFGNGFYAANKRAHAPNGDAAFRPVLHVATHDLGDAIEIKVRDNGTGIPPAIRDKLFQPFFTTKPTGEGTGLGLSISYDIVTQQHGGTIAVDSEEGKFTEFTIRLPRTAKATATRATI
jgi:signal transduction histidine kinase